MSYEQEPIMKPRAPTDPIPTKSFHGAAFALSIDKISFTYFDPDGPCRARETCDRLSNLAKTAEFPALKLKAGRRHEVQCVVPIPLYEPQPSRTVLFQTGARFPGICDHRLEFNPSKLGPDGIADVVSLIDAVVDAGGRRMMLDGLITRADIALDLFNLSAAEALVWSKGQRKHGIFSDQSGRPETYYLGTARSNQTVAYTKKRKEVETTSLRIERRLKPKCVGGQLVGLSDPFHKIRLVLIPSLLPLLEGLDPEHFCDSVRIRGFTHVLARLPAARRKAIKSALRDNCLLSSTAEMWRGWPQLLKSSGLGFLIAALRADVPLAPDGPEAFSKTIADMMGFKETQSFEGEGR